MRRFWTEVTAGQAAGGWQVLLDAKPLRTQGGNALNIPSQALAEALAAEWRNQGEEIDTAGFVMRDMADYAIDKIAPARGEAIDTLLAFAETDTLCYRAEPGEALFRKQEECWEPLLVSLEQRHNLCFTRVSGVIHQQQASTTIARLRGLLESYGDFTLAGLHSAASLAASLTIALASMHGDAGPDALWALAQLEEEWQSGLWGRDEEAETIRAARKRHFEQAAQFMHHARNY